MGVSRGRVDVAERANAIPLLARSYMSFEYARARIGTPSTRKSTLLENLQKSRRTVVPAYRRQRQSHQNATKPLFNVPKDEDPSAADTPTKLL